MIEKIKAELKKQGLPLFLVKRIKSKITKEEEIEGAVSKLKEETPAETLKIWEEMDGDVNDYTQSESDRAATQAIKTHDEKVKQKQEEEKKKAELDKKKKELEGLSDDDPKFKALTERIDQLTGLVEQTVKTNQKSALKSKISEAIKEAKLPALWVERVDIESEDQIEGAIKKLSDEYSSIEQSIINKKLEEGTLLPEHGKGGKIEDTDIKEFVESQTKKK